jgi:ADP-heptose:LPS heptosyltransferase
VFAVLALLVSVDTGVVHLAAAMGRPTWVLLPYAPDWRWLLSRDDSPWYPGLRLFRQPAPNGWGPAIQRITTSLHELARSGAHSRR